MPFEFPEVVPETALATKLLGRKDSSWLQSEASEIETPENSTTEQPRRPALWVFPADEAGKGNYCGLSKADPDTGLLQPVPGAMPAHAPESPEPMDTGADAPKDCKTEQAELGSDGSEDCKTEQAELGSHSSEDCKTEQAEVGVRDPTHTAPIPAPAILKRLPPISPEEQSALAAGKGAADDEAEKPKRSNRGRGGRGRGRAPTGRGRSAAGRGRGRGSRVDQKEDDVSGQRGWVAA